MSIRNTHKVGDYLMQDDDSGYTIYRSEAVKRWDGLWVRKDQYETRQPQEFVRALNDPKALVEVRPESAAPAVSNTPSGTVGLSGVSAKESPADHIFT